MSVNILKVFISENAGPISIKFHVQLQGRDGVSGGGGGGGGEMSHDQDGCIEIFLSSTAGLIPMKFCM